MLTLITIDAEHSRDLDDAIWCDQMPDGTFKITVAISSVAGEIQLGSETDLTAKDRVASRYFSQGTQHMLPVRLAEDLLSLTPSRPKKAQVIEMRLNSAGSPTALPALSRQKVTNRQRVSFTEVPAILADVGHPLHKELTLCARVAHLLLERRRKAGALALYDLNEGWTTTEEGFLVQLDRKMANVGYIVIQEFMVLANAEVARLCAEKEIPVLFRNHTAKAHAPDRAVILEQLMGVLGSPGADARVAAEREHVHMILNRANYSPALLGHFGLNLPAYLHITSPIRRYADLVNQRQLRAYLKGEPFPYTRKDLEELGTHINVTLREREERRIEQFKGWAEDRAEAQTDRLNPVVLADLKPADFERVLKTAIRSGEFKPPVVEAFRLRAEAGKLQPLDLFCALNAPSAWRDIKIAAVDCMQRTPQHGPSVIGIANSILGWPAPVTNSDAQGPDHARSFTVSMVIPSVGVAGTATATTLKMATQRAAILLLAQWGNVPPPAWPEIASPPSSPIKAPPVPTGTENPVSQLQELCQKDKNPLPEYNFDRKGGPDHAPLFICTCQALGVAVTSAPFTDKKAAKKQAADLALQALHQ